MMSRRLLPVALCATLLLGCATPSLSGDFVLVGAGSHGTTMWRVDDRARGVSCYYISAGGISCVRTSPALVVEDTTGGRR